VADTRIGQNFTSAFGPPSLVTSTTRNFPIQSSQCGIPMQIFCLAGRQIHPTVLGQNQHQHSMATIANPVRAAVGEIEDHRVRIESRLKAIYVIHETAPGVARATRPAASRFISTFLRSETSARLPTLQA
jgi:hypothetical protein